MAIKKDLKKRVNEELGITVQGIKETCSMDLLREFKCSKEGRGQLDSTFKEVIADSGFARHLIPRIEVIEAVIDPNIDAKDVEEAVRGCFDHGSELELKFYLTKKLFRGNRKAYVETWALKFFRATHIKIEMASCRVRRQTVVDRCLDCREPDRSRSYWRCGKEGNTAGCCPRQPQCYLCTAREDKPRDDHISRTMRCAAFREAAPMREPSRARV